MWLIRIIEYQLAHPCGSLGTTTTEDKTDQPLSLAPGID